MEFEFYVANDIGMAIRKDPEMKKSLSEALNRFSALDFGNPPFNDMTANASNLKRKAGILHGFYDTPMGRIRIEAAMNPGSDVAPANIVFVK